MKNKIIRLLKNYFYLSITTLIIFIIFITSVFLPWDLDYEARFLGIATSVERLNVSIIIWTLLAVINGVSAFLTRRFNKWFSILSFALCVVCLLNFLGVCILY